MSDSGHPPVAEEVATSGRARALLIWLAAFLLCLFGIVYLPSRPNPPRTDVVFPTAPAPRAPVEETDDRAARVAFFDEHVQSAINAADKANREAADRCAQRIRDMFDAHRQGVEPFTEDLTSWGTRWNVLRRMPGDWWNESDRVQVYVTKKFERHLFSNESLQQGLEQALQKFREDIEANDNALLTDVRAALSQSDLPEVAPIEYAAYAAEIASRLQAYSAEAATASVQNLVLTELASGVAGAAATQIGVMITTRIAAMAATSAAGAGGATAAGGATGGAGGTLAGPAGTAVGAAAGLIVGVIVDLWMSSNFRSELAADLNAMIDSISAGVIDGSEEHMGLKQSLIEVCDAYRGAHRQALYDRIVKDPH